MSVSLDELEKAFSARFQRRPRIDGLRRLGREAEHPIVHPDGTLADCAALWPLLAEGGDLKPKYEGDMVVALEGRDYAYSAEVGIGTLEVITEPREDLGALAAVRDAAIERLLRATDKLGYRVLGYGCQPITPGTTAIMTPKQRYGVLLEVLGDLWLTFTVTASDQVQVDLAAPEVWAVTDVCNLLAPVTVALCANSSVLAGRDSGYASSREGTMGAIHAEQFRHGMPRGAWGDAGHFVRALATLPHLLSRSDGQLVPEHGTFEAWLAARPDFTVDQAVEAFLLHEHYVWHAARPRTAHGTLELRSACQQPPDSHDAAAALALGFVEGAPQLLALLRRELGNDPWPAMRRWHHDAMRFGLQAEEPVPNLCRSLLEVCAQALEDRGRGEAVRLAPLFARAESRRSPAHVALEAFQAEGGPGLVRVTALG